MPGKPLPPPVAALMEQFGMTEADVLALAMSRGGAGAATRRGQVLDFTPATGKVTARVQGSRPRPYKVTITVLPLTSAQWREVESRLPAQALFRARLLAGEMPAEIEQVFTDAGTPLFPRSAADLDMRCSCPDWEVPCKHLAAVCYVLAEAFDDDPFAMLAWRGKTREDLLTALRGRATAAAVPGGTASPAAGPGYPAGPAAPAVRPARGAGPGHRPARHPGPSLRAARTPDPADQAPG